MNDWFDAEHHVDRAHEHYEAGRWDDAASELREALALNPYRAEWHFNLGLTLEAAGRFQDAVKAFRDAHALQPGDAQTLVALGINCLRLERPKEAIEWLAEAQRHSPSRPDTYIHRIEAYARLGDHDQAETMYYLAHQCADARAASAERDAEDAEDDDGAEDAAAAATPEIPAASPDLPDDEGAPLGASGSSLEPSEEALALANLAESLMDRGLHQKAIWCLREAARLDPRMPHVHARLASAYAETGRQERARQLYLRELRERPGCVDTLLDLGELLADMGRFAEAGEKFRRVLELESDNPEAHFCLGDLAERQGADREAAAAFRVVHRIDPERAEVRRRLARLALRAGDVGEARRLVRADLRALRREPERFEDEDVLDLGDLLLEADLPADACSAFRALLTRLEPCGADLTGPRAPLSSSAGSGPDLLADAWHCLGVASFRVGDRSEGLRASRRALRLRPQHAAAIHNMALARLHMGQAARARVWLRRGLAIDPEDASLRRLRTAVRLRVAAERVARAVRAAARLGRPAGAAR